MELLDAINFLSNKHPEWGYNWWEEKPDKQIWAIYFRESKGNVRSAQEIARDRAIAKSEAIDLLCALLYGTIDSRTLSAGFGQRQMELPEHEFLDGFAMSSVDPVKKARLMEELTGTPIISELEAPYNDDEFKKYSQEELVYVCPPMYGFILDAYYKKMGYGVLSTVDKDPDREYRMPK